MVLREERPVVSVEVVPTELIRVRRAVVRGGERTVADTVRREQIEVEGAEIRMSQSYGRRSL
jgi:stress response protein YsnF